MEPAQEDARLIAEPLAAESQGSRVYRSERGRETETMNWRDCISVDPNVIHGVACIAGTRIPVALVLDNLAARVPEKRLAEYRSLTAEAIRAALAYAAELAREQNIALPA